MVVIVVLMTVVVVVVVVIRSSKLDIVMVLIDRVDERDVKKEISYFPLDT